MNSRKNKLGFKYRSFNRNKVSWRYIKKIYVAASFRGVPFSTLPMSMFRIFEPAGTENEFVLYSSGYNSVVCAIRLISLLKFSGTTLKKETLINLLKTEEGCNLVKQMIEPHIKELNIPTHFPIDTTLGFYNFKDNRTKWMRKNIISIDTN